MVQPQQIGMIANTHNVVQKNVLVACPPTLSLGRASHLSNMLGPSQQLGCDDRATACCFMERSLRQRAMRS